uniref:AB hydrolase-1 domain-containing protein n=1 Tax=Chromera velia CCMP2878 TaxID=1169474 RepID=A0A0G4I441_9ALVE|eukprot:Cvel_1772.t1-p1 / transcript=Cvel_1772.t1 / gene=Cvel_1772 / organism=Chromera_velia_CCMP2878 / gene_product=Embryogenesis-associated protein EMB8, putative / transcript_product=Embryogenesis-associated protein EMB8, putative / location=Cvel_scaffold65:25844-31446(-) / protein_length=455 / sequence_SO=supercontig / SO=protein_coding / is_pseudo=false
MERVFAILRELRSRLPGAKTSLLLLFGLALFWRRRVKVDSFFMPTKKNKTLLRRINYLLRGFSTSLVASSGFISSTLVMMKKAPKMQRERQVIETFDGTKVALDWLFDSDPDCPPNNPVVMAIHGLNGHSEEGYMRHLQHQAHKQHWHTVALNLRGCGGVHKLPSPGSPFYSGAFTEDIRRAVEVVRSRFPDSPLFMVGFSLGANLLVKYLGEEGEEAVGNVTAAISAGNPWNFENIYKIKWWTRPVFRGMAVLLRAHAFRSLKHFDTLKNLGVDPEEVRAMKRYAALSEPLKGWSIEAFDHEMTRRVFGYESRDDYYRDASSIRYLPNVKVPLLCLNAADDPVVLAENYDEPIRVAQESNENVIFLLTGAGGHLGWSGSFPDFLWKPSWADKVAVGFFQAALAQEFQAEGRRANSLSSSAGAGTKRRGKEEIAEDPQTHRERTIVESEVLKSRL